MGSRIVVARSLMKTLNRGSQMASRGPTPGVGRPRGGTPSPGSGSSNSGRTFSSAPNGNSARCGESQFQTHGLRNSTRTRNVMRNATRTAAIGLATHAHLATALMNWIQAWDEFDDT